MYFVCDNAVIAFPQAREKQQLDSEMSARKQGQSHNSMLMLVREAESEVSKDKSLAKPH